MWKDLVLRKDRQLSAQRTTLPRPNFLRIKSPRKKWEKELHMVLLLWRVKEMFQRLSVKWSELGWVTGVLEAKQTMWIIDKTGADIKMDSLDDWRIWWLLWGVNLPPSLHTWNSRRSVQKHGVKREGGCVQVGRKRWVTWGKKWQNLALIYLWSLPCFEQGAGPHDFKRYQPTKIILWF